MVRYKKGSRVKDKSGQKSGAKKIGIRARQNDGSNKRMGQRVRAIKVVGRKNRVESKKMRAK